MGSEFTEVGFGPNPEVGIFKADSGYPPRESDPPSGQIACFEGTGGFCERWLASKLCTLPSFILGLSIRMS